MECCYCLTVKLHMQVGIICIISPMSTHLAASDLRGMCVNYSDLAASHAKVQERVIFTVSIASELTYNTCA
jgi:hypothetical protein